ncbi:hypothetical protein LX87_05197 [Larkinella arboricola]|uniref:Uncharacterized protein n=1 Tax=Larkinella arboricola TaxID=643671 RepID=A0A327WKT2_LARAB|nr:hypothetical protein [Larkinella arboricola]RAJ92229.1 hypothetical protein LX87_05197 [Larkinella arboricola]
MYLRILDTPSGGLEAAEGEMNAGGITRLRLMPASRLMIELPDLIPTCPGLPDPYIDGRSIFQLEEGDFVDIDVIPKYASYSENLQTNPNGEYYQTQLQLVLPKDRPAVTAWIHRKRGIRWIALFRDRNGFNRLAGTQSHPLRMEVQGGTGTGDGQNARTLTFSANTPFPALYVESLESQDLFANTEFDFAFSFDFNT